MKRLLLFSLYFLLSLYSNANRGLDSLYKQLDKCKETNCLITTKNKIVYELVQIDLVEAQKQLNDVLKDVSEKDGELFLETKLNQAFIYLLTDKTDSAFIIINRVKFLADKKQFTRIQALSNYYLTKYFIESNDLKSAIENAFVTLRQFEKLKDNFYVQLTYSLIGTINYKLKNENKAIDYFKKALEIGVKNGFASNLAYVYNNLGNVYANNIKTSEMALEYYRRALSIRRELKHEREISPILSNIGIIYFDRKDYELAERFYKEALDINLKANNKKSISINYTNIGNIYFEKADYKNADIYYKEALKYLENDLQIKEMLLYNLSEVNNKLGNLQIALQYNDSCMSIKDSLYSREAIKSLNDMQVKYETEKTKLELEKKDLESKNKQVIIYAAFGGCLLLLSMVFIIFRGLKNQERANLSLEEKNKIITEKNLIVEQQHKDITDSIKYAERIQNAILPPEQLWKNILPDSFVFYKPKDILSGDFYWIEETKDHLFVAAADCTGHGVPGALVSIVNYNLLNKAVLEKNLSDPGEILSQVNIWLTQALHQSYQESQVRDGMDISLCMIHKSSGKLYFSGAFNSAYIIRDYEIHELIADKKPVGSFIEEDLKPFTVKEHQIRANETFYFFTDGYADQFGGPNGKKMKYKKFQELLIQINQLDFEEQYSRIQHFFNAWKGNLEQTDDVLVIGFKFLSIQNNV